MSNLSNVSNTDINRILDKFVESENDITDTLPKGYSASINSSAITVEGNYYLKSFLIFVTFP